jgi:hypothetical protein
MTCPFASPAFAKASAFALRATAVRPAGSPADLSAVASAKAEAPWREGWWIERDSNPRLPLARRLLSQLSYRPKWVQVGLSGARSWFRANLSAVSTRRFHQISFPSELARVAVIETASSEWRSEA